MQRGKSRGDHENTEELNQLKFEIQQKDEMLLLKTETAKNLEKQLEQQKKRMEHSKTESTSQEPSGRVGEPNVTTNATTDMLHFTR